MLALFISVLAISYAFYWINDKRTRDSPLLAAIPNAHFSVPFSRLWLIWLKGTNYEHRARHAAHLANGPVVRIAPREISVNCVDGGIETVYGGGWEKTEWYSNLQAFGHRFMLSMGTGKDYSERKRMLTNVYSNNYVQNSTEMREILREKIVGKFNPLMREWAAKREQFDMYSEVKAFFMDVMTAYYFGLANGTNFLEDPEERKVSRHFELSVKGLFWLIEVPTLTKWASHLGLDIHEKGILESYEHLEDFCFELCQRAKKSLFRKSGNQASQESDPASAPIVYSQVKRKIVASGELSEESEMIVAAEMLNQIQDGHEGPAITVTFLMCEIAQHPNARTRLYGELLTLGDNPSLEEIETLPYLDALLLETMRRYPALLGPYPRYVPDSGAKLGGYDIPPGVIVSGNLYSLHRNPDVFPNPEEWRPERWIEATEEQKAEMRRWFWTFGSGGRMCIGCHIATNVMKALIVGFYKDFEAVMSPLATIEQEEGLIGPPKNNKAMMSVRGIHSATDKGW